MFILSLAYTADLDAVDAVRDEHMVWVREQFAAGRFVASGPKVPRTGGVILARGLTREEVDAVVATDPFVVADVCAYDIVEFAVTTVADGHEALRD
jgi:uncharacterized protein YciI